MAHDHSHHSHTPGNLNRAFAIGTVLNLLFVVIEASYGLLSHSLALVADAGHNLSDVMTLLLAWAAMALAKRAATARHTFGFKKGTILASLCSALFLYAAIGVIIWEAVARLRSPVPVDGMTITIIAAIGVVVNTATAFLFMAGRKDDLNIKGAFLHMAADAVVSAGVVVSGLIIAATGWNILDPVISIAIACVIILSGWGLLKDSLHLAMAGVPAEIDPEAVLAYLRNLSGVQCVYDLHIWAASTTENVLTAHLVMENGGTDEFLQDTAEYLRHNCNIHHSTIQIERFKSDGLCLHESLDPHKNCWPGKMDAPHHDRHSASHSHPDKA